MTKEFFVWLSGADKTLLPMVLVFRKHGSRYYYRVGQSSLERLARTARGQNWELSVYSTGWSARRE